ncbi:hypothetical protein JCM8097_007490 [Rhodosporidiobolus ruineniae]
MPAPIRPLPSCHSSTLTKSRSSTASSSSPTLAALSNLSSLARKARKVVVKQTKELERQKEKLNGLYEDEEIEKAATALIAASNTFTSTSYKHLEVLTTALTAARKDNIKMRRLRKWAKRLGKQRRKELMKGRKTSLT